MSGKRKQYRFVSTKEKYSLVGSRRELCDVVKKAEGSGVALDGDVDGSEVWEVEEEEVTEDDGAVTVVVSHSVSVVGGGGG